MLVVADRCAQSDAEENKEQTKNKQGRARRRTKPRRIYLPELQTEACTGMQMRKVNKAVAGEAFGKIDHFMKRDESLHCYR